MTLKRIFALAVAAALMPCIPVCAADELFFGTYTPESFTVDAENGVTFETEVPDGDYTVTVKTGGDTETKANVYINGGERVRAYTLAAGETQDNVQPAVPKDGKISVQVLGESPNVTEIDIRELPARTEPNDKPVIYIAGDSTAQTYAYKSQFPQTGWGQVFSERFTDDVVVDNRAMGGRSAKRFDNDGRLDAILTEMHPGDYVLVQFGINDGSAGKPERYISPEDYKTLLADKYIGEVRKRGGVPVLLTPTAAAWWDEENNCFTESRQDYAPPTLEAAEETDTPVIDICDIMTKTWNAMGKDAVFGLYFVCEPLESKVYPAGTDDHTHLKAAGARVIAGLIADAIKTDVPELAPYVKGKTEFTDIEGHWAERIISALHDENYVNGTDGDKFEPNRAVTRAELLKLSMDAAGLAAHAYRDGECLDAANEDWYCYYLQGALDKGLIPEAMVPGATVVEHTKIVADATKDTPTQKVDITSYTGGAFNGDTPITREEAAALVMACAGYAAKEGGLALETAAGDESFADAGDVSEAYRNAVDAAKSYGIVEGDDDNVFSPKSELTRAEAAAIISRIINQGVIGK